MKFSPKQAQNLTQQGRQIPNNPYLGNCASIGTSACATTARSTSRAVACYVGPGEALTRYCDDGRLEIDNLPVEYALRRERSEGGTLFAGADSGGERRAAIYSLIRTAKLDDSDPQASLRFMLVRIVEHAIDRIDKLMPRVVTDRCRPGI